MKGEQMDPLKAFEDLLEAVESKDWETAVDRAEALKQWSDKGGLLPIVLSYHDNASFSKWMAAVKAWAENR